MRSISVIVKKKPQTLLIGAGLVLALVAVSLMSACGPMQSTVAEFNVGLLRQTVANSLIESAFFAFAAIGLSLVFGVMKTANLAHGEFFMVGAYSIWLLYSVRGWPFFAVVVLAGVIGGLLGLITERFVFRPVRGDIQSGFIISVGIVFILQVLAGALWGMGMAKGVASYLVGSLKFWGVIVPWQRLIMLPIAGFCVWGLFLFLHRTGVGRAIRASALDDECASLHGVSPTRMAAITLAIGSAFAAIAGALMAPIYSVHPWLGANIIWFCFVVIIVGGLGNLKGTLYAAILIGFVNVFATSYWDSTMALILANLIMIGVLAFRPQGIVGYAEK